MLYFFGQISILHQVYGLIFANSTNNTAIIRSLMFQNMAIIAYKHSLRILCIVFIFLYTVFFLKIYNSSIYFYSH